MKKELWMEVTKLTVNEDNGYLVKIVDVITVCKHKRLGKIKHIIKVLLMKRKLLKEYR